MTYHEATTPSRVIVADIETVPLPSSSLLHQDDLVSLFPILQKVVCISYVELDEELKPIAIRTLGLPYMDEKEAVRKFVGLLDNKTMLVTWGGRGFDVPVILYRAMKYGIPCTHMLRGDFPKRYSPLGHLDLQDDMTLFGATRRIRLDHAAAAIGLPGKMETKASDVQSLVVRNRLEDVRTYCVTDAVQTFVLFLRWAHTKGMASIEEVNDSLDALSDKAIYAKRLFNSETLGVKLVKANCNWNSLRIEE